MHKEHGEGKEKKGGEWRGKRIMSDECATGKVRREKDAQIVSYQDLPSEACTPQLVQLLAIAMLLFMFAATPSSIDGAEARAIIGKGGLVDLQGPFWVASLHWYGN